MRVRPTIGLTDMTANDGPLDRALQHRFLLAMRQADPARITEPPEGVSMDDAAIDANLLYLEEHGLCDAGRRPNLTGYTWLGAKISARGLDFLADGGGLSAILATVTVRLHAETLRDLIAARIEAAPIPPAEKSALRRHLAARPEIALRAATPECDRRLPAHRLASRTDLAKLGMQHLPDVATWLRTRAGL